MNVDEEIEKYLNSEEALAETKKITQATTTGGEEELSFVDRETGIHCRGISDYTGGTTSHNIKSISSDLNSTVTKRVIELLEAGLALINRDQPDDALSTLKSCETLYHQYPGQLDDNYLSVLKYNMACCH